MGTLSEYLDFVEKVDKRIRNEKLTELLARAELVHRADFASKSESEVPPKLALLHAQLVELADEFGFKSLSEPVEDEEHHTWSICFTDAQGATRCIDWNLASSPEFRQMMAKYTLIKEFLEPPFLIEYAAKATAAEASPEAGWKRAPDETEAAEGRNRRGPGGGQAGPPHRPRLPRAGRKADRPRTLRLHRRTGQEGLPGAALQGPGRDDLHAALGDHHGPRAPHPAFQVKLEDIAETEAIFTTLMGEDVEARRKFIEDNALDVKNLDI